MAPRSWSKLSYRVIIFLLGGWLLLDMVSRLAAEILWFGEVGYSREFFLRFGTQLGLCLTVFVISAGFLLGNIAIALRLRKKQEDKKETNSKFTVQNSKPSPLSLSSQPIRLRFLLPVVLGLSALVGLVLIYYGSVAFNLWQPITALGIKLPALPQFKGWLISPTEGSFLLFLTAVIVIYQRVCLALFSLLLSLLFASLLSGNWIKILQFFHPTNFNQAEPLFNLDISFYIFSLPFWELLTLWLLGLFLYGIISVGLIYLRAGNSLSEGYFSGFTLAQRLQLNTLACLLMVTVGLRYWLLRYSLLFSQDSVNYGASYTAVKVQLPMYTFLSFLGVCIAISLLWQVVFLYTVIKNNIKKKSFSVKNPSEKLRRKISDISTNSSSINVIYPPYLVFGLALFLIVAAVSGELVPNVVQRFIVQPNELARERPYIERTIALTREGFNLNSIEAQIFTPQNTLSELKLKQNDLTVRNIRLWDTQPLLRTNRQLQQIRPYYKFKSADIDRYTFRKEGESNVKKQKEKQQTIIAARELDFDAVPQKAQTWVNEHLVYTHGYGFTLSPVNTVAPGGLPDYYVKDIGVNVPGGDGALQVSNERIRESIPIGKPRIYYGEVTNNYVMTGTKTRELDYPSGDENVYNIYDGRGGISIAPFWRRLLFAQYLKDWKMLLTGDFTPKTKLLFRRNILERVETIAPFLRYDSDPYLVAADAGATTINGEKTYLYWIIDAYTTSNRFPYSDPGKNRFNYIRNSVKVVIDAYNGGVNFYVTDITDPIITTFGGIFPKLFKPLEAMPASLYSHIRYPVDLFETQSERLLAYNMTDPQVFYNREDLWQIPKEIYGREPRPVQPYFLITNLPDASSEEFILLLPFTPTQRPNLIAWLAARSDGDKYGKLLLYEFPKQQLVYGTEQIEALINQDPVISQQISLWNREGSRVLQGNLLIIPIEQSLLYVEPLYLEAEQNSLPTLIRVIVAYNNRIVMAETLQLALKAIFQEQKPTTAPIVRPVQ
jgi:uncharacterized protein